MIVQYYEAVVGAKNKWKKYSWPRVLVEVGSPGGTVTLQMARVDGVDTPCRAELTVAETKKLIEGLLDALTGRCPMTFEQRNRFCKSLEMHPTKKEC